jgi:2-polyprenyl-3-methyl-5-hydroxy-6-metoxy-1,4-benzoquinol methylase
MVPTAIPLPVLDTRIPAWDFDSLVERICPFCRSEGESRFLRPDRLSLRECGICGAYYVSPAPSESQIDAFYETYHRNHCAVGYVRREEPVEEALQKDPLSDFRLAEIVSTIDIRGRRILDVGFGAGVILHHLRSLGARVSGIETDPDALTFAKEELGIEDVRDCKISEFDDGKRYSVITLFDLIEHVSQPLEVLQASRDLLEPGGLLAVWTPDASFAGEEEAPVLFRVDLEHLQYLSTKTCCYLSTRLDLEIIHLESVGFPFLDGIRTPGAEGSGRGDLSQRIRRRVKTLPGFQRLNASRLAIISRRSKPPDLRLGRYHLYSIFRKSAG